MIQVTRSENGITISGHAGYAERGSDIVCAGVSTLVQTLVYSLRELTQDQITAVYNCSGQIKSIEYRNLSAKGKLLVDSFFVGIEMIADTYPKNVKIDRAFKSLNCKG